jgi:hypothetical protein
MEMQCVFCGVEAELSLLPASGGFFLVLLFDHEDGGDLFLQNVWLCPNHPALQPEIITVCSPCCENLESSRD